MNLSGTVLGNPGNINDRAPIRWNWLAQLPFRDEMFSDFNGDSNTAEYRRLSREDRNFIKQPSHILPTKTCIDNRRTTSIKLSLNYCHTSTSAITVNYFVTHLSMATAQKHEGVDVRLPHTRPVAESTFSGHFESIRNWSANRNWCGHYLARPWSIKTLLMSGLTRRPDFWVLLQVLFWSRALRKVEFRNLCTQYFSR